jgi:CheY-like chemotaxis protein
MSEPVHEAYVVPCWNCAMPFDVESSHWCNCDAKLLTLVCPHCVQCFCAAPLPYKRRFWNDAPELLRSHTGRFRIAAAPVSGAAIQPHVLIVDDDEPIRSLAACLVEQLGYRVTTAGSAEEALVLTGAVAFDVVLTDALMPKMDGRELSRQLKRAHGSRLKVIVMTALYTARRFQTEARNVFKVDEYIAKPLRYDVLRDALERVAPIRHSPSDNLRQGTFAAAG